MPIESKAQRRAMYAAKEGHSTLGIPKKVGADFVAAGDASKNLPERKTHMDKLKHSNPRMQKPPMEKMAAPSFGRVLRNAMPPRHPGKLNT